MSKKERGRPMCSHQVHVIPEYRETPDMEKLGQALISVAVNIAERKKTTSDTNTVANPATSSTEGRAA